jgi:hypothetical protein
MLLAYLGLSGCSWFNPVSNNIELSETMPLLAPIGPTRHIIQSINVSWGSRRDNFLCVLELDRQRIALAGLSPQGMSLFNLTYDGNEINMTHSPLMPDKIPPEMIVKDLQLAFWPVLTLQKQLSTPWRLTAIENQRHLFYLDQLFAEVTFLEQNPAWPKSVELINHRFHYKLLINTVSYEIISE